MGDMGDGKISCASCLTGFDFKAGGGMGFNLTEGHQLLAQGTSSRAHDTPVVALHLVLLQRLERHHLLAAFTLVLHVLNQHLPQQAPPLSHRRPACWASPLTSLSHRFKAAITNQVTPWAARNWALSWDGEADRALHLGLQLLHQRPVLGHLLHAFLLGQRFHRL